MDSDDMIVVIVGDNEDVNEELNSTDGENAYANAESSRRPCKMPLPLIIKEELKTEYDEDIDVMQIIETAERYGEPIFQIGDGYSDSEYETKPDIKELISQEIEDYIDEPGVQIKEEPEDNDYDEIYTLENDEMYLPESENEGETDSDNNDSENDKRTRTKMISPEERKSFVEDLRQEYPELQDNEKKLIRSLAEIMRNIKRPPPPQDYFIMNDIFFECRKCGKFSQSEPAAERHYQEMHGTRYLVCFACGVDFRSTTNLYKHEKRCMAPDAILVLKARALSLGRKGRSRPFIPKPGEILLRKPITKKFKCPECPGAFMTRANLEAHVNLHRGLRPYRCDQCPCAYTSSTALKRHQRTHSGEVYICDHCGRPFKIKEALVTHMNTHLPVPRFGCLMDGCGRRFATKNALSHHVRRVHLRLPPACACRLCPRSYPRMSLLRDHMKKQHGLSLMTRKMFFKALPKLSDSQLSQMKHFIKADGPMINLSSLDDLEEFE